MLTVQYGYTALLDSLLLFCPTESALYWRPVHLSTLMQAQARFNQPLPALPPIWLPPLPYLAGGVCSAGFLGALLRIPPKGPAAVQRRQRQRWQGARLHWRWRRQKVLAWDHGWVGYGSSLDDELAGQGLGRWTSPSAGSLGDVVVVCGERLGVAELFLKFVRGQLWIFHTTITLLFIDEFNSIVFQPTKIHLKIH
jgi:hypothetical protein